MLLKLLLAWVLMAVCVVIHASGVTEAIRWVRRDPSRAPRFWPRTWMFVRLAGWVIFLHLLEIAVWAVCYEWQGTLPDLQSALYFSAVTYTTTGYGDIVLPREWQLVGGIEALTGILMCGWSTGFFFAVLSRILELRSPSRE